MIVIAIPSRGLMHSRTMNDILNNLEGYNGDVQFVFSHGRPQPEAQNYITDEALALKPSHILYIDDDMQIPPGVLMESLKKNADVVVAHYPCTHHGSDALHIRDNVFESAGLGWMLIKAHIFDKLTKPYFRTDVQYVWNGQELAEEPVREGQDRHGGQDVYFSQQLVKAAITPAVIDTKLGQYSIINNPYRKYGNSTQLEVENWILR